ncbi:hypothetical protein KIPB_015881, partial [Kipferlia bialata]|eukprot:g15881.t1
MGQIVTAGRLFLSQMEALGATLHIPTPQEAKEEVERHGVSGYHLLEGTWFPDNDGFEDSDSDTYCAEGETPDV